MSRCDERLKARVEESTCLTCTGFAQIVVYYESIKRELKIKSIYECRCDERLQTKTRKLRASQYTGLTVELEQLKIETRLTIDKFASAMGEYVTER
jgi:hypothetical protein